MRRHVHVLRELDEDPERRITFHDVLGKDFRSYGGEWRVASDSTLIQVDYELEAEFNSAIMRAFCRGAMRHAAEELLEQVRSEMLRRAGGNHPSPTRGLGSGAAGAGDLVHGRESR